MTKSRKLYSIRHWVRWRALYLYNRYLHSIQQWVKLDRCICKTESCKVFDILSDVCIIQYIYTQDGAVQYTAVGRVRCTVPVCTVESCTGYSSRLDRMHYICTLERVKYTAMGQVGALYLYCRELFSKQH
jgi:hypothetical protein